MRITEETKSIERMLDKHFPQSSRDLPRAYRYNPASLRIRLVDPQFANKNRVQRERIVLPLIKTLPENTRLDIMFLLLLAPDEVEDSLANFEYAQALRKRKRKRATSKR